MLGRTLSGVQLLLIGSVLFFGTLIYTSLDTIVPYIPFVPYHMRTDNAFLIGEYYFNHDDDPRGPYDLRLARKYYTKALQEDPEVHPFAWYQLGRIDFLENRSKDAIYKFGKQIEYFGNTVISVHYMLGLTYAYRARSSGDILDWENAEKSFQTFLELKPESPWARTDLAWVYFSQGRYDEMLPVVREGLSINPTNPWLLNMYGLALLNTGKPDDALAHFLSAHDAAGKLTTEEWGLSYPGNDPALWQTGLDSFIAAITHNIEQAEAARTAVKKE